MEYAIHDVQWTDEKISRFWDFQNNFEPFENLWFTSVVGKGVIRFVNSIVSIKGEILDYGTGKGHLIKQLLQVKNCRVSGFDFSMESASTVNRRNKNEKNYYGTYTRQIDSNTLSPFPSENFDFVFLIETIEHIAEHYLSPTLLEIHRILKKDGVLVVTTPNNENLNSAKVNCPDCGCVFHRVQHLRSFTKESISALMQQFRFTPIVCRTTDFICYNDNSLRSITKKALMRFNLKEKPHLVYIGKK